MTLLATAGGRAEGNASNLLNKTFCLCVRTQYIGQLDYSFVYTVHFCTLGRCHEIIINSLSFFNIWVYDPFTNERQKIN